MSASKLNKHIIVVGQTPPPVHGQAVMIQRMLEGSYGDIRLHHIPMRFSNQASDIGRFQFDKLTTLVRLIADVWKTQKSTGAQVLYYPPAGPHFVPMMRDVLLLLAIRNRFKKTIFHFHAGGLSTFVARFPRFLRAFIRRAYGKPDMAVYVSDLSPRDGAYFQATRECIIPNGIPDLTQFVPREHKPVNHTRPFQLLFVGALQKSKGALDVLHALKILRDQGHSVQATLMGAFPSKNFETEVHQYLKTHDLEDAVSLPGVLTGNAKLTAFARADLFCFPSYYESEALPVVILEAMCYGLPVVSTRWRGIPSQVVDGETGFLVPIKQPQAVADAIARLTADPALCSRFGTNGRRRYEEHFSLAIHHQRLHAMFEEVLAT